MVNRQKDGSHRHYEIRERAVDLPDGTRGIRPDIAAVLTSGYPRATIEGCQDEAGFIGFIQKPCEIAAFRSVVESVIATLSSAQSPNLGLRK